MDTVTFRTRQAIADLLRVPGIGDSAGPAILNERDERKLLAAFAGMLGSALCQARVDPLISDLWTVRADRLRSAPSPFRAAVMNGVQRLCELGLLHLTDPPSASDLVTVPLRDVAPLLIAIGRRMTPEERAHVAQADYGRDVAHHRAALDAVLDDPALAYPEGEAWYPAEVVELVSHVPGTPGHVSCLAIVLLAALQTGDAHGDAEFRLGRQHAEIAALHAPARDAFFAAFRHLYETCPHWSPSVPESFTLP